MLWQAFLPAMQAKAHRRGRTEARLSFGWGSLDELTGSSPIAFMTQKKNMSWEAMASSRMDLDRWMWILLACPVATESGPMFCYKLFLGVA